MTDHPDAPVSSPLDEGADCRMNTPTLSVTTLLLLTAPAFAVTLDATDTPRCGSLSPLHQQLGDAYYDIVDARYDAEADDKRRYHLPEPDRSHINARASALVAQVAGQRLRRGSGERQRCLPDDTERREFSDVESFSLTDIGMQRHGDRLLVIHAREETRRNSRHARMDLPLEAILDDDLVSSDVNADDGRLAFRRLARRPAANPYDLYTGTAATASGRTTYLMEVSTWLEKRGDTLELVEHVYVNGRLGSWARWEIDGG